MKCEFIDDRTGDVLMEVEHEEYEPGKPGLGIVTPLVRGRTAGITMSAEDVIRLRGVLDDWIQEHVTRT